MAEQLTLEIIQNSPRLRELAALPGDEIKDGKLIRNFSEEGDRMDLGEEITQENFKNISWDSSTYIYTSRNVVYTTK